MNSVENETKLCEAALIAAKALDRFVDILDKGYKLIVRRVEAEDIRKKGRC
jgi:hypothetical protein